MSKSKDNVDTAKHLFQNYVEAASDLAESVKQGIAHEGKIDNETVAKLNAFIIASNEIADMPLALTDDNETDTNLQ